MRIRMTGTGAVVAAVAALAVAAAGCGGSSSGGSGGGGGSGGEGTPQHGGSVVIDRVADSESMDKTTVFDNESIWVFEQIMEPLYTVTKDGQDVEPWLATSYTLSPDKKTYTFKLRPGVKFSNGQPMTSADVKFSIDEARKEDQGWGFLDVAIKDIEAPSPDTVVIHTKYQWSPLLADIALFANAVIPKDYGGETKDQFYEHPVGTGPFMWDHWDKGNELVLKRNPNYWQKGKPYLDSVTWRYVGDDNTRELQLQGGQSQVDEFPPFQTVDKLQSTPGVKMSLFPSTRTDYMMMNERYAPLADVHVRRAISLAIDRQSIIKSVLFGHGDPANSFMPPQVPYYDKNSPGLQYNMDQAKQEMAQSKYPNGFDVEMLLGKGTADEHSYGQIIQQSLQQLGIKVELQAGRPVDGVLRRAGVQVPARLQLLDDGHRRPRRARHLRRRPELRGEVVLHRLLERRCHQVDTRGPARVRQDQASGALLEHPEAGRRGCVHGVPLLLAVPVRVHGQAARVLRVPDR